MCNIFNKNAIAISAKKGRKKPILLRPAFKLESKKTTGGKVR